MAGQHGRRPRAANKAKQAKGAAVTVPSPSNKQPSRGQAPAAVAIKGGVQQPAQAAGPFESGSSEGEEDSQMSSEIPASDNELQQGSGGEGGSEDDSQLDDDELDLMDDEFMSEDADEDQPPGTSTQAAGQQGDPDSDSQEGDEGEAGEDSEGEGGDPGGPGSGSGDPESGAGEDAEGEEGGGGHTQPAKGQGAKFTEGGKGASFSKAFTKIMQRPVRGATAAVTAEQKQRQLDAGPSEVVVRGVVGEAAILSESRTLAKRKEEAVEEAEARAAKRARHEARRRGRLTVPRRGENVAHDTREKTLQRMATRGVVMLFNAVTKAQRAQQEAVAMRLKGNQKASKGAFLSQLQTPDQPGAPGSLPSLGAPGGANESGLLGLLGKQAPVQQEPSNTGWQVLQESFTGLAGGSKMKDWDKELVADDGQDVEANSQSDGDGGDEGW